MTHREKVLNGNKFLIDHNLNVCICWETFVKGYLMVILIDILFEAPTMRNLTKTFNFHENTKTESIKPKD